MQKKEVVKLKAGEPVKPGGLSELASKEWDRLVTEMKASGIPLAPAYRSLLTQAATLSADVATAWAAIQRDGRYLTNKVTGAVKCHPAVSDLTASRNRLVFVLVELGLTPKHRQATAEDGPLDPMSELLGIRRRAIG